MRPVRAVFRSPEAPLFAPCRRPVAILLLCTGCFRFAPLTPATPPGEVIEITLTSEGTTNTARTLGNDVAKIRGRVIRTAADSVKIDVDDLLTTDGRSLFMQGLTVGVALRDASEVRVRTLDRRRSTIAAVASLVAVSLIIRSVSLAGGGEDGTGGGGGTPTLRFPNQ